MKILVVEDHPLVREAVGEHLKRLDQHVEILEAQTSADACKMAAAEPALGLVLLDLNLPDAEGCSALTDLRRCHEGAPIVVLSGSEDRELVLDALGRGAMGFIPKTVTGDVMLGALRLVLSGGVYLPPCVVNGDEHPAGEPPGASPASDPVHEPTQPVRAPGDLGLSGRQAQVLALMVQGKPNKLICRELDLAESTVKLHVSAILRALNVSNRTQAVIAVGQLGLRLDEFVSAPPPGDA